VEIRHELRELLDTLWDFFTPAFQCPHQVERVGTLGDGGKWVCGLDRVAKQKHCVIYSFGVNGQSSFERDLLRRAPGCEAWGYDLALTAGDPRSGMILSLGTELTSKPGRLVRPTSMKRAI